VVPGRRAFAKLSVHYRGGASVSRCSGEAQVGASREASMSAWLTSCWKTPFLFFLCLTKTELKALYHLVMLIRAATGNSKATMLTGPDA